MVNADHLSRFKCEHKIIVCSRLRDALIKTFVKTVNIHNYLTILTINAQRCLNTLKFNLYRLLILK